MSCTSAELERARRYRERHRVRVNRRQRERTAAGLNRQPTAAQKRASELRHIERKRAYQRELQRRLRLDPEWRERDVAAQRARYAASEEARARAVERATRRKKALVIVEHVDRRIVFERDEGVCGICNSAVDPADWHLDHVVAIARGGEHSYANTQVSHPLCNRRKGAR